MSVQWNQRAIHKHHIDDSLFEALQMIEELPKKSIFTPPFVPSVNRMPIPIVRGHHAKKCPFLKRIERHRKIGND